LGVDDRHLPGEPLDDVAIVLLAEIAAHSLDHRVADLIERVHLGDRLLVALRDLQRGVVERVPRTVAARQRQRRGFADVTDAERIDETVEPDLAPGIDGVEQVLDRGLAIALDLFQFQLRVTRLQREDIARLLHPALVEEIFDLLLAEAVDVEGAAGHEQHQMLDLLERTGELAGAAGARALFAGCRLFAHHVGVQRARALLRKVIFLRALRPFVDDDVDHLRDDVAGALDDDGVADADIAALAQALAFAADALDVVLVVQRHVLHDDAADADRVELADRRQRAGAA